MAGLPFSADQLSRSPAKFPCRVATTGNITLAGSAPNTVDGVSLAAGNRILVWQQSTASQNGIYYVSTLGTGANGTWTRAKDADQDGDFEAGHKAYVSLGTLYQKQEFSITTSGTIIIGTTGITFERIIFGSINDLTLKASPTTSDVLLIEDVAAANAKKRITIGSIASGGIDSTAIHDNVAGEIFAITAKSVLDEADVLLIEDSTAGNAKKSVLVSSLVDSQVLAKTANYTILTSEEGSLFTNQGAASEIDFTLPPASTGLGPFHFYNLDANGLRVIAGAGDTIRIGVGSVTAFAGNIKPQNPTDIGAFVTLVAVNATQWVQMSLDGSWTAT